jgi:urease accessory protein
MGQQTDAGAAPAPLYRLLAWLSPGFPVGGFSYSHGLEAAVESGAVSNRGSLQCWVGAILAQGGGRMDADILRDAHGAAAAGDLGALTGANERGLAYRATAELALEATAQGEAFLATARAAWPDEFLNRWAAFCAARPHANPPPRAGEERERADASRSRICGAVCYPVAVGAATARAGIPLGNVLVAYLHAMAANLISAGLRLGVIGQTDGQRILAALEPVVVKAAAEAATRDPADFGAATFAVDLASIAHETQYTRLFRS